MPRASALKATGPLPCPRSQIPGHAFTHTPLRCTMTLASLWAVPWTTVPTGYALLALTSPHVAGLVASVSATVLITGVRLTGSAALKLAEVVHGLATKHLATPASGRQVSRTFPNQFPADGECLLPSAGTSAGPGARVATRGGDATHGTSASGTAPEARGPGKAGHVLDVTSFSVHVA